MEKIKIKEGYTIQVSGVNSGAIVAEIYANGSESPIPTGRAAFSKNTAIAEIIRWANSAISCNLLLPNMVDGNTVIAEFMGLNLNKKLCEVLEAGQLKYHSSWDWLMPVVKKCFKINKQGISNDLSVSIFANNHIEIVWAAVIMFIEQQNNHLLNGKYPFCSLISITRLTNEDNENE